MQGSRNSSFLCFFSALAMSFIMRSCNTPRSFSKCRQLLRRSVRRLVSSTGMSLSGAVPPGGTKGEDSPAAVTPKKISSRMQRQHVNPLAPHHQVPVHLPDTWVRESFTQPQQRFVVDVGCAKGTWLMQTAATQPDTNFLGLEIRPPMVEIARARCERAALTNAAFLKCNANVDLKRILQDIAEQGAQVELLCIHHPDPHFKKRNKKRAVVLPQLVEDIAEAVQPGTRVYLQSDVQDVAEEMNMCFVHEQFEAAEGYDAETLLTNPGPHQHPTEREVSEVSRGGQIFRMMFRRI